VLALDDHARRQLFQQYRQECGGSYPDDETIEEGEGVYELQVRAVFALDASIAHLRVGFSKS